MVLKSYDDIDEEYQGIKAEASRPQACTVMIMVAPEVDAMASARMLTQLLRADNIAYALRPVSSYTQIMRCYERFMTEDIRSVFMINCGGSINLPKAFRLEAGGNKRVFVLDNHRPFHLANIHSLHQVTVFAAAEEIDEAQQLGAVPSDGEEMSVNEDDDTDEERDDEEDEMDGDDSILSGVDIDGGSRDGDGDTINDEEDMDDAEEGDAASVSSGDASKGIRSIKSQGGAGGEDGDGDDDGDEASSVSASLAAEGGEEEDAEEEGLVADADKDDVASKSSIKGSGGGGGDPRDKKKNRGRRDDGSTADDEGEGEEEEEEEDEEDGEGDTSGEGEGDAASRRSSSRGDGGDEEDEEIVVGRRRRAEHQLQNPERNRRRRVRSYYAQASMFSAPTALMLLKLVTGKTGAHVPVDLIWQAILGVTDQHQRQRISEEAYNFYCDNLRYQLADHLASTSERGKYVVGDGEQEVVVPGAETGNIEEGPDFRFFLYRQGPDWSLFDAMCNSPYVAAKLAVWQSRGKDRLSELLAKMGVPLHECMQTYSFMSPQIKMSFAQQIVSATAQNDYNFRNPEVMYRTFFRSLGSSFRKNVAACDVVYAASSLVEMCRNTDEVEPSSGISRAEAFYEAYDCLGMGIKPEELMRKGVHHAISLQKLIVRKASVMLEGDSIQPMKRFYFSVVNSTGGEAGVAFRSSNPAGGGSMGGGGGVSSDEGELDSPFSRPMVLTRLGQFIMDVKRNLPKRENGWIGKRLMPLILVSELRGGTCLVIGISPLSSPLGGAEISKEDEDTLRQLSNFKQYFKLAAKEIRAAYRDDAFDANTIELNKEDVYDFIGTLDVVFRHAMRGL